MTHTFCVHTLSLINLLAPEISDATAPLSILSFFLRLSTMKRRIQAMKASEISKNARPDFALRRFRMAPIRCGHVRSSACAVRRQHFPVDSRPSRSNTTAGRRDRGRHRGDEMSGAPEQPSRSWRRACCASRRENPSPSATFPDGRQALGFDNYRPNSASPTDAGRLSLLLIAKTIETQARLRAMGPIRFSHPTQKKATQVDRKLVVYRHLSRDWPNTGGNAQLQSGNDGDHRAE